MTRLNRRALLCLGLPALPLAFVALPLYVIWPHYFANRFGVSLGLIGGLLLLARTLDALLDPLLGHWSDRLFLRGNNTLLKRGWLAAIFLSTGFVVLFFPHWLIGHSVTLNRLLLVVLVALLACYLGYSFLQISLQAWGARLGGPGIAPRHHFCRVRLAFFSGRNFACCCPESPCHESRD